MSIAAGATVIHETGECRPAQHLARAAKKAAARLENGPFLLEIRRNRHVHYVKASLAIGAKWMLLHRLSYLFTVSSRLSISLATIVQAASSGAGIDGLNFASPTPSNACAAFGSET